MARRRPRPGRATIDGDEPGSGQLSSPAPTGSTRFVLSIENVAPWTLLESGAVEERTDGGMGPLSPGQAVFDTPVDAGAPGPALPGHAFEIEVEAVPGDRLSFVTMFGMSNDWFFGTPAAGLELFCDDGSPLSGDVSSDVRLFDVGSELDQEIAVGDATAPQQLGPDTGADDPDARVRRVSANVYPVPADEHLRVTLTPVD